MANIDSILPAAPNVCPIELLFAVTETFSTSSFFALSNLKMALASQRSPAGVEVACVLMWSIFSSSYCESSKKIGLPIFP